MGFRQRDPAGNLIVDISTRLPRIMGRISISLGVNGAVTVPASGSNPLVHWFNASASQPDFNATPRFTDDGNTISWSFSTAVPVYNRGGVLVYGRY